MRLERELTCREIVELVTAYLEDALQPADRERFEEHLVFCDGCDNYLEQMRQTVRLSSGVEADIPSELEERLLEVFRGWQRS
jgi:predicted anti-sigma-YlaC factor YlaD